MQYRSVKVSDSDLLQLQLTHKFALKSVSTRAQVHKLCTLFNIYQFSQVRFSQVKVQLGQVYFSQDASSKSKINIMAAITTTKIGAIVGSSLFIFIVKRWYLALFQHSLPQKLAFPSGPHQCRSKNRKKQETWLCDYIQQVLSLD